MKRLFASAGISLMLGACSVGMAMSGKEDPNLSVADKGALRGDVETQLGKPIKTTRLEDGAKADIYEYAIGNEPSATRAVGHAMADILTLGLWEVAGTPIERAHEEKSHLTVYYDKNDKVTAVSASEAASMTAATESDENSERNEVAAKPPGAGSAPAKTAELESASSSASPPPENSASAPGGMAADSPYRIQLASHRFRSGAEQVWAKLQATWPEIFGTRELVIVEKDIADRGTFYRVQTGGFDTLRDARSMCATLRAQKQACFALKRS